MDITYKKYDAYSAEDLLRDDYFIASVLYPTQETDAFWTEAVNNETIAPDDYQFACYFIRSVQVKREHISREEIHHLWGDIEAVNKNNLKKRKNRIQLYLSAMTGVAALFALLFIWNNRPEKPFWKNSFIVNIEDVKAPEVSATDIQLILADDKAVSLEDEEAKIIYKENGIAIDNRKQELSKKQTDINRPDIYNQLIVPQGKRSVLTLADGSKIWLNARSRVVYPVAFDKKKREIYVDGEAFLEVSHNENCPFIVKTKELSVEVLGTSFNIMAYDKDSIQNIVLVEGSVKIHSGDKKETVLSPNEMYARHNGLSEIKTVNAEDYISWKRGIYQYKSEYLGVIMQRLSRYYGQEIECSPEASLLKCSGKLDLKSNLPLVLDGISKTAPIVWKLDEKKGNYKITKK